VAEESEHVDDDIGQDGKERPTPGHDRPADSGPHDPASEPVRVAPADSGPHDPASEPVRVAPADSGPHDPASVPAGGDSTDDPAPAPGE
jgi:hypothetical protein